MTKSIYFLRFIIIFSICIEIVNAQDITTIIDEQLVIGADENAPREYLFSQIEQVSTDSKHNIYVADKKMAKIRVFNSTGKFLYAIGNRGQGPGEMQEVTSMTIDQNDDLIVVDRMNRRFTRFSKMGKEFKTYPMPDQSYISPWFIRQFTKHSFLLYYRIHSPTKSSKQATNKMFHIYPDDFSNMKESFGRDGDMWDMDQPFLRTRPGKKGMSISIIKHGEIVFVPKFYEGKIYLYIRNDDVWELQVITGRTFNHKSYQLLDLSDYPDYKFPLHSYITSGSLGKFGVIKQNESRGIFGLKDGKIVHFSYSFDKENNRIFGVELFGEDGIFLGYTPIQEKSISVLARDKDDRFYGKRGSDLGFPVVTVFRLDYQINEKGSYLK